MASPDAAKPSRGENLSGGRPGESARDVREIRVLVKASEILGDKEKAARWLQTSNSALLGDKPIDRLTTDAGEHAVLEVLARIAYGLYS